MNYISHYDSKHASRGGFNFYYEIFVLLYLFYNFAVLTREYRPLGNYITERGVRHLGEQFGPEKD